MRKLGAFADMSKEQEIVKAAVDFANLEKIKSTEQVQKMFSKFTNGPFQTIPSDEKHVQEFEKNQAELRERLSLIADGSDPSLIKLQKILLKDLKDKAHADVIFEHGKIDYIYKVDGVQAGYNLALAFMLDRKYKVGHLKQCGNPDCRKFLPNIDVQHRPRNTCDKKVCKQKADAYQKKLARQ